MLPIIFSSKIEYDTTCSTNAIHTNIFTCTYTHTHIITLTHKKEPKTADSNDIKPDGDETVDDIWPSEDDNKSAKAQSKDEPDKATEKAQTDTVEV